MPQCNPAWLVCGGGNLNVKRLGEGGTQALNNPSISQSFLDVYKNIYQDFTTTLQNLNEKS